MLHKYHIMKLMKCLETHKETNFLHCAQKETIETVDIY